MDMNDALRRHFRLPEVRSWLFAKDAPGRRPSGEPHVYFIAPEVPGPVMMPQSEQLRPLTLMGMVPVAEVRNCVLGYALSRKGTKWFPKVKSVAVVDTENDLHFTYYCEEELNLVRMTIMEAHSTRIRTFSLEKLRRSELQERKELALEWRPDCHFCATRGSECDCSHAMRTRTSPTIDSENRSPWQNFVNRMRRVQGQGWLFQHGGRQRVVHSSITSAEWKQKMGSEIWRPFVDTILLVGSEKAAEVVGGVVLPKHMNRCLPAPKKKENDNADEVRLKKKWRGNHACTMCDARFRSPYHLRRHVDQCHLNRRDWNCSMCDKSYKQKSHLDSHVSSTHAENEPPKYSCIICGRQFCWRSNVNRHYREKHMNTQQQKITIVAEEGS